MQNSRLKKKLIANYPKILVEANPTDIILGIGLSTSDVRSFTKSTWLGQNLLGYILTCIRDEFMLDEMLIAKEHMTVKHETT